MPVVTAMVATSSKNCLEEQFAKLRKFEQMIHNDNLQNKDVKNNILPKDKTPNTKLQKKVVWNDNLNI